MNTSEYIAKYLADRGVKHVFGIIGSAMYTLFTALGETEGIDYICPLHEQAAGFGADGYSRISGGVGVAIGTVGPGATNLITACAGSYLDSIPVLYLVGINSTLSSKGNIPIRSYLFQEIDTEALFKPITKAVYTVKSPEEIRSVLDAAFYTALEGRKGPVAVMLPEDVMYADTHAELFFETGEANNDNCHSLDGYLVEDIKVCKELLNKSRRPLFLFGAGIHLAGAEEEAIRLIERLRCPVALSYPARDLLQDNSSLNVGSIGIFGSRSGNYALQTADLLICVGIRLEPYVVGNPRQFGTNAKTVVVDIDVEELNKLNNKGPVVYKKINCDAKVFLAGLFDAISLCTLETNDWLKKIAIWKKNYPLCLKEYELEPEVNPYFFVQRLSMALDSDDVIFTDTGLSAVWIGQAFSFKTKQRWFSQFAFSSMGYSLPAAIGSSFASDRRIICITGDGGLQMNIQEFASVVYHQPNIKIFAVCNGGYGLIQKTQDDFNKGHYATDRENHVPIPNSGSIAEAYGIKTYEITKNEEIDSILHKVLKENGPVFCSVYVPIQKRITPRVKSGNLLNMYPFLSEDKIKTDTGY